MSISASAQDPPSFTQKGSSITSVVGSFSSVNPENGESQTSFSFGASHIGFVGNNIGAGIDATVTRQSGGSSVTLLGFGPKLVTAFRIPDSPVYPYVGAGYNLFVAFPDDKDTETIHVIKGGFGVLVEVADHLVIPLEFTIGFPLGEYSEMKMYRFSIGLAILGY